MSSDEKGMQQDGSNVVEFTGSAQVTESTPFDIKLWKLHRYTENSVGTRNDLTQKENYTAAYLLGTMDPDKACVYGIGLWAASFARGLTKSERAACEAEAKVLMDLVRNPSEPIEPAIEKPIERLTEVFYLAQTAKSVKRAFELGQQATLYSKNLSEEEIAQCRKDADDQAETEQQYNGLDLIRAILNGDIDAVEEAVASQTYNIDSKYSPLHLATMCGENEMVLQLIAGGADVDQEDSDGNTALHLSTGDDISMEAFTALIEADADIDAMGADQMTPLHCAAMAGAHEKAQFLIDAGAEIDTQAVYGDTALLHAAWRNKPEVVAVLIGAGADVNAKNHRGDSSLDIAKKYGYTEVVDLLMEAGAVEAL